MKALEEEDSMAKPNIVILDCGCEDVNAEQGAVPRRPCPEKDRIPDSVPQSSFPLLGPLTGLEIPTAVAVAQVRPFRFL